MHHSIKTPGPASPPLVFHVPGEIRGKGRPRFGGGRTYTDAKTLNAEAWVRHCAVQAVGQPCLEGALYLSVNVTVGIPESWSKIKKDQARLGFIRPTGRPDCDNLLKLLADSLNKIVWKDDSQIVRMLIVKRYGAEPGARIQIGVVVGSDDA